VKWAAKICPLRPAHFTIGREFGVNAPLEPAEWLPRRLHAAAAASSRRPDPADEAAQLSVLYHRVSQNASAVVMQ